MSLATLQKALSLGDRLDLIWEEVCRDGGAECPVCQGDMELRDGHGHCATCGSTVS